MVQIAGFAVAAPAAVAQTGRGHEQGRSGMADPVWAERGDTEAVAGRVAAIFGGTGPVRLALPGGHTPIPIFDLLKGRDLPWARAELWPTDDRIVPQDHPASNFGLLSRAFGDSGAALRPLQAGIAPPPFDLVWLGMGGDGHVASIFPNMRLPEDGAPAVLRVEPDPLPPEAPFARLTLNLPALVAAREIILVLAGDDKRRVIEAAIAGSTDLPVARLIARARCPVTIFWSPA
jgi:6-phosphogluconolactonase